MSFNTPGRSRPCCTSDNVFETDQWVEMIQVNECGLRESSGGKEGGDRCWCEVCLGRLWMCFNRESDGREKWRFGLDDKNIYTVVPGTHATATEK